MRDLRIGIDDGSGAVFVGDPATPVDSELGVELLVVNAQLMECWGEIIRGRAYGLAVGHHEDDFDELAVRQREVKQAIRDLGENRR